MAKKRCILSAAILAGSAFMPVFDANAISYSGTISPLVINEDSEITLNGASIDASGMLKTPSIEIKPGVTLTLTLEGENYIQGGKCSAGIHVSPAYTSQPDNPDTAYPDDIYNAAGSAKLIIKGSGSLTALGGDGTASLDEANGSYSRDTYRYEDPDNLPIWCGSGAGIGGNSTFSSHDNDGQIVDWAFGPDFGTITIDESFSGNINAAPGLNSKYAHSGYGPSDRSGNVDEYGGAAGIGGGGANGTYYSPTRHSTLNGIININGGTIVSTGHHDGNDELSQAGSGIGAGGAIQTNGDSQPHNEVITTINGGNVTTTGGIYAAGIGGGANTTSGIITITGGTVNAVAGRGPDDWGDPTFATAAGIGSGEESSYDEINITGGTVYAESDSGAAIGGGEKYLFGTAAYSDDDNSPLRTATINISGANTNVTAVTKGYLKYGSYDTGAAIGSGSPGLSSRYNGYDAGLEINITDHATVRAYAGPYANAIGSGAEADEGDTNPDDFGISYGIAITIDDTVDLFAASQGGFVPAIATKNNMTGYYQDETPLSFQSSSRYLVQHQGDTTTANHNIATEYYSYCTSDDPDVCNTDYNAWAIGTNNEPTDTTTASFTTSGDTMEVTVEGNAPTSHTNLLSYTSSDSFALISGSLAANYCSITVQHIDAQTGLKIIDDWVTDDDSVCGEVSGTLDVADEVLAMGYDFVNAIDTRGQAIDLPLDVTNTEDGMIFKLFYLKKSDNPDSTDNSNTPETLDTISHYAPFALIALTGVITTTSLIKRSAKRN